MISILAKLLGGSSIAAWLVVFIAAAGALGGYGWYMHHAGYKSASIEWQGKLDGVTRDYATAKADETERVNRISDAQKAAEARTIADLQGQVDNLETQRKENADAAHLDPDANRPAVNAAGVLRLNAIH